MKQNPIHGSVINYKFHPLGSQLTATILWWTAGYLITSKVLIIDGANRTWLKCKMTTVLQNVHFSQKVHWHLKPNQIAKIWGFSFFILSLLSVAWGKAAVMHPISSVYCLLPLKVWLYGVPHIICRVLGLNKQTLMVRRGGCRFLWGFFFHNQKRLNHHIYVTFLLPSWFSSRRPIYFQLHWFLYSGYL